MQMEAEFQEMMLQEKQKKKKSVEGKSYSPTPGMNSDFVHGFVIFAYGVSVVNQLYFFLNRKHFKIGIHLICIEF